jgi:hypothetical protein
MAMLDFAVLMTEDSARIVEEDRQRLRDAGFPIVTSGTSLLWRHFST